MNEKEKELNEIFVYVKKDLKCNVERIGTWLWVDGNASKRKELEDKGFKYSKTRDKFYYTNSPVRKSFRRPLAFDDLRQRYSNSQLTLTK